MTSGETDTDSTTSGTRLRTLLRLLPYVKPFRWYLIGSAGAVLAAMVCGLATPLVIKAVLDGPVAGRDPGSLGWLIALITALGVAEALLVWARRRLASAPGPRIEANLRADLYRHLQRLPVAFHDQWQSGQLLSRAVTDLSTLRRFIGFSAVFIVVNTTTILLGIGVLFVLDPWLGLITLACGVPLVLVSAHHETRYAVLARRSQDQAGDLATTVEESVLGIRVLKAFGRGPDIARRFAGQAAAWRRTELAKYKVLAALIAVIILLPELGLGLQLLVGALGIADGTMTVGTLVAAVTVAGYLRWPIDSIGWLLADANQSATACERYWEVRDAEVTITDPAEPADLPATGGELRFEGVRFTYPGAGAPVLDGVDLVVRPGETLALVGPTGSGKTTLTALVPRLADVTGGRVLVDGVDVRDARLADLRATVATAFEEPVLFSASVRENVALGSPGATDDDVWLALRVASAEDFVRALPWGLDTRIGEQGLSLSGGQRQRLALARAVVGRPRLLVLDDPLSALDVHTEAEVERALRRVLSGVSALVVAHRSSTVRLADRVAVLDGGRVTAVGTHAELLATDPGYRALMSALDSEQEGAVAS
ncbi:ABC transporter ATP-binding protein [Actinokineospora bangkokensis]|uniref:ABC transporter n=1 Tax=Actinokineospora bangkokensis TaxID=1193682 RepID=A0A1Q9LCX0_9PSEU|nr:ABC transporter ATP-binding protein [Actinokineospora bangkokensis]OLR89881.1 ABC transporter [Actinokineospora bangkokensis]